PATAATATATTTATTTTTTGAATATATTTGLLEALAAGVPAVAEALRGATVAHAFKRSGAPALPDAAAARTGLTGRRAAVARPGAAAAVTAALPHAGA